MRNAILPFILYLFSILYARTIPTKNITYDFYVLDLTREYFIQKGLDIDALVAETESKLENSINSVMANSTIGVFIKFQRRDKTNFVVEDDSLMACGTRLQDLAEILNQIFRNSSEFSTIVMSNCGSDSHTELFRSSGMMTPYVTHQMVPYCSTRTLIFNEPEYDKFLSMFGTALLKAAGVRDKNPLRIEEVTNGDSGKDLVISITDDAMKQLQEEECFSINYVE